MFLWENFTFGELVIYYEKFSTKGREKLKEIQKEFDWTIEQLDWLIACIGFESQFKPRARNRISKATGLIQFMPLTAEYLGTTIDELLEMTDYEQLEYVKKYFKPYAHRIESLEDMYMAILMPRCIGKTPDYNVFSSYKAYRQNIILDLNKDGKVTIEEATERVRRIYNSGKSLS